MLVYKNKLRLVLQHLSDSGFKVNVSLICFSSRLIALESSVSETGLAWVNEMDSNTTKIIKKRQ